MIVVLDDYRKSASALRSGLPARHDRESAPRNYSVTRRALTPELPEDFSTIDIKPFFERVCALATQI